MLCSVIGTLPTVQLLVQSTPQQSRQRVDSAMRFNPGVDGCSVQHLRPAPCMPALHEVQPVIKVLPSSHRARSGIPFVGATRFRTNTYSRKVHQVCAFCEFGKFCHVSIQCTAGSNGCVLGLFGVPSSAGCSHWHQTDNNCTRCLDQLCTQQRYSRRCHCWQWL